MNAVTAAVKGPLVLLQMSVASADVMPASVCKTQGNGVKSRAGCS